MAGDYEIIDKSFKRMVLPNAALTKLGEGFAWLEGPVWFADGQCLLVSDLPSNRVLRWTSSGGISVFRDPSDFENGHARDMQGRLISCSHHGRITRTELDGRVTVLADAYEGKPLNSPNDVVVKSDGTIWFSDPPYGTNTDYEGGKRDARLPANLFRLDPRDGSLTVVADDFEGPNGLAFSPVIPWCLRPCGLAPRARPARSPNAFDARAALPASRRVGWPGPAARSSRTNSGPSHSPRAATQSASAAAVGALSVTLAFSAFPLPIIATVFPPRSRSARSRATTSPRRSPRSCISRTRARSRFPLGVVAFARASASRAFQPARPGPPRVPVRLGPGRGDVDGPGDLAQGPGELDDGAEGGEAAGDRGRGQVAAGEVGPVAEGQGVAGRRCRRRGPRRAAEADGRPRKAAKSARSLA